MPTSASPTTPPHDSEHGNRRKVCGLLIALAVGLAGGRILSVERLYEPSVHRAAGQDAPRPAWPSVRPAPSPTFSSNDRSRWAAVRALIEQGTFVIGQRDPYTKLRGAVLPLGATDALHAVVLLEVGDHYRVRLRGDSGIIFEEGFESVDKVLNPSTLQYYSSKPPLLTVMVAGEYWLLKKAFGWSLVEQRWEVVGTVLATFNLAPLMLYLAILAWLAERLGASEWSSYFIVAAGGFATLVTPFLITLNNHTLAATGTAAALYALVRIEEENAPSWLFGLAGLAAGFTACMELPAAAFAVGIFVYLLWQRPGRALFLYAPLALLPVAALLAANYIQLGELQPAYSKFRSRWYEYEGSHWLVPSGQIKRGIDFAGRNGETKAQYAFHLLLGHHGLFSLTPVMLLAVAGIGINVWRLLGVGQVSNLSGVENSLETCPTNPRGKKPFAPLLGLFTLLVSAIVIAFYIIQSDNYGGWSNGPRWLMWLTPLWLVAMLPALDRCRSSRLGRALALVLLTLSVILMSYQQWNPWRHPWIYNWMESRGWISY